LLDPLLPKLVLDLAFDFVAALLLQLRGLESVTLTERIELGQLARRMLRSEGWVVRVLELRFVGVYLLLQPLLQIWQH
jgi:hypothetical protein